MPTMGQLPLFLIKKQTKKASSDRAVDLMFVMPQRSILNQEP